MVEVILVVMVVVMLSAINLSDNAIEYGWSGSVILLLGAQYGDGRVKNGQYCGFG